MRQLTINHLRSLLLPQPSPCISIYLPTHRSFPDNQQDPIRYRHLLKKVETSLGSRSSTPEIQKLLGRFGDYAHNEEFWRHRTEGLAVLASPDQFEAFDMQRSVPELAIVADSFHVKPLIRMLQSSDRYQVLCLDRHQVKLYEGNRYALDPVDLDTVPATLTEALGEELTEPHLTVASYGKGSGAPHAAHGQPRMYHGHGGRKDEIQIDAERFFRVVDRAILEHHSRPSGLPLILVALAEHHPLFRAISRNPFLFDEGIRTDPEALDAKQLRSEAWRVMEPLYLERLSAIAERFHIARSRQLGSDDLAQVAERAIRGQIDTLLVEADRVIPGNIDANTGGLELGSPEQPVICDVLDDLAEVVLCNSGEVIVAPSDRMPSITGVAAIYRF